MPAISSALQKIPGATGVSWGEALAMITSRPAQAIGMGGEIGSLAPGRRADVVIWSGDPLEGVERGRARLYRRRRAAAGDATRRGCSSVIATCRGPTCRRRTGIDPAGGPALLGDRVHRNAFPACRIRCGRRWSAAIGERPFQGIYSSSRCVTFGTDGLFLSRHRPRTADVGGRATRCGSSRAC